MEFSEAADIGAGVSGQHGIMADVDFTMMCLLVCLTRGAYDGIYTRSCRPGSYCGYEVLRLWIASQICIYWVIIFL